MKPTAARHVLVKWITGEELPALVVRSRWRELEPAHETREPSGKATQHAERAACWLVDVVLFNVHPSKTGDNAEGGVEVALSDVPEAPEVRPYFGGLRPRQPADAPREVLGEVSWRWPPREGE